MASVAPLRTSATMVATPSRALPRGESFNFEEENSGNEEDTETSGGTTDNG